MNHKQKTFTFTTKIKGKDAACRVSTRKYTFEIKDVLINRIGEEKYNKIFADESLEFDFKLKDVEEDFPKLLLIPPKIKIDYSKQDWDELLNVYAFFLLYEKNAKLRALEFNNETLALAIKQAQTVLASMPEFFSQKKS